MSKAFILIDEDEDKIDAWLAKHNKTCQFYDDGSTAESPSGPIGGRLTYSFIPTSVGEIMTVECKCGEIIDITPYENW